MKALVSVISNNETFLGDVKGFVIPKCSKLSSAPVEWGFCIHPYSDNSVLIQREGIEMDLDLADILKLSDEFDKIAQVFHDCTGVLNVLFEYEYKDL